MEFAGWDWCARIWIRYLSGRGPSMPSRIERRCLAHISCVFTRSTRRLIHNTHFAITPSGAQRTRVKPSSSFSAYLADRRALEDYGSYIPPLKSVLKVLKGLDKQLLLELYVNSHLPAVSHIFPTFPFPASPLDPSF